MYPLFITDTFQMKDNEPYKREISSMPNCFVHNIASMMSEIESSIKLGITAFILFPKIEESLKSTFGTEAYNSLGLIPSAVRLIKSTYGDRVTIMTDVALDPYSDMVMT